MQGQENKALPICDLTNNSRLLTTSIASLPVTLFDQVMGMYDEIEPTFNAVQAIKSLPETTPILVISMMRMRHDLADGRADAAWSTYQTGIIPILEEFGGKRIVNATVALALVGQQGQWDILGAFWYPGPKALWRFMSDERVIDLMKVRRTAADDVNMLILHDLEGTLGF
jgi:hypothetical protein